MRLPSIFRPAPLAAAVYGLGLIALTAAAPARSMGDSGEYLAYALAMSRGFTPPLTDAAFAQVRADIAPFDPGLAHWAMEDAARTSRDGRRDFVHFWLYPALAAPAVAVARLSGADPRFGFAALNIALLTMAFGVLWRRIGWPPAVLLLAGPVIWWADKVHPEAFIVSLMVVAFAVWRNRPGAALACVGLVAAQVLPFGIFVPLLAAAAVVQEPGTWRRRPFRAGLAAGVLLPLVPVAYYLVHFGTPSLLGELAWSDHVRPPPAGAVLWDLNIGLVPNWPILAATVAAILAVTGMTAPRRLLQPDLGVVGIGGLALLLTFPAIGNFMHGATPGIIRYAIWLVPLAIPILALATPHPHLWRATGALAIVSAALSVPAYHPAAGEFSHRPTAVSLWVWRHYPAWSHPTAEIFARSLDQRAATVPLPAAGCGKILLVGRGDAQGMWPRPCAPAPVPDECRTPGAACYANRARGDYAFRPLANLPDWLKYDPAAVWPRQGEQGVRALLEQVNWRAMRPIDPNRPGGPLAAVHALDVESLFVAERRALAILVDVRDGARIDLPEGRLHVQVVDAATGRAVPIVPVQTRSGALSLPIPPSPGPLVIALSADAPWEAHRQPVP